jgi:hypothetical protein
MPWPASWGANPIPSSELRNASAELLIPACTQFAEVKDYIAKKKQ